jgi:hypothetical protein
LLRTRVKRSKEVRVRRIGGFENREILSLGIVIRDILTGEFHGTTRLRVEDRWHSIGDQEKESPESIDIRVHDPANSEVPTR